MKSLLLAPSTIKMLGQSLSQDTTLFYYDAPDYILNFFTRYGFALEHKTGLILNKKILGDKWISEEEFNKLDILSKKYLLTNENWLSVINIAKDSDKFYCDELLTKDKKDFLRELGLNLHEDEKLPPDILRRRASRRASRANEINPDSTILQFTGAKVTEGFSYRRYKLNAYLKERFTIDTVSLPSDDIINKHYKLVIFSDPRNSYLAYLKAIYDKSFIVYDKTDNWRACGTKAIAMDDLLMKNANIIFCSSKFLYDTLADKSNAYFVPNGCDVCPYEPCEKYKRKTAVYIGHGRKKINWQFINSLAKQNPDWDILIYGEKLLEDIKVNHVTQANVIYKGSLPEEELFEEIKKCHVGLIPFLDSAWTRGMLPLKLFKYTNARLPTLYINCPECEPYSKVAFPYEHYTLNDLYDMKIEDICFQEILDKSNWKEKFDFMLEKIGERLNA